MKISEKGINFIRKEEGERLKSYLCPAGILTIGVGHTGKDVVPGLIIDKERSRELLRNDLRRFEKAIEILVEVPLKQYEYDSLVSFAFNVGAEAFRKSTLLKKINSSAPISEIEVEFRKWVKGGGKILPVLQKRREAEIKFFKGEGGL